MMLELLPIIVVALGVIIMICAIVYPDNVTPEEKENIANKYKNGFELKYNYIEIVKMFYEASTSRAETINENVINKLKKQTVPYIEYKNDSVIIPWKYITSWRLEYQYLRDKNLFMLKFNVRGLDEEITIFADVESGKDSDYEAFKTYAPTVRLEGTTIY